MVAGAPRENNSTGAAYIFALDNGAWRSVKSLTPPEGSLQPQFGYSLALSSDGRMLAAGAPDADIRGINDSLRSAGTVYLYYRDINGWHFGSSLIPDNPVKSAGFGTALALSGDGTTLAVGANRWNTAGATFIFSRDGDSRTWNQQARIDPPTADAEIHFGASLALSGDGATLAIGAYRENGAAAGDVRSGAVYIYTRERGTWQQQQRLEPSNSGAHDEFGTSLSINRDGTLLVVGAPFEDNRSAQPDSDQDRQRSFNFGAAYLFSLKGGQWRQTAYIKPIDDKGLINERFYGEFGTAMAMSRDGSTLAIGAPHGVSILQPQRGDPSDALNATSGTGATYIYSLPLLRE